VAVTFMGIRKRAGSGGGRRGPRKGSTVEVVEVLDARYEAPLEDLWYRGSRLLAGLEFFPSWDPVGAPYEYEGAVLDSVEADLRKLSERCDDEGARQAVDALIGFVRMVRSAGLALFLAPD